MTIHIINLAIYFAFASLLIIVFVYDSRWGLIPDFASYGIFGLAVIRILNSKFQIPDSILNDFLLVLFVFALFFGLWFFSRGRAMGFGDVKLAPAIALFLGWPLGLLAMLFSFWFGALYGILALCWRRGITMKSEISFGPFLVLGAFIALFWGNEVFHWYSQLLL
ncbi:A24 family peptidase [Patescibacteria group bacterium]|nr:A24 family peptidase [Patescibacteria group bacterium]